MGAKEAYLSKPWLKYYPEDIPQEVDIPDISVPKLFDDVADKYSSNTALIFYGKKLSYKKLKELTDRFAAALADMGVKKGDTVAMYLLNCPQFIITYFGALKAGAKVTPISPVYTSIEVKHQIEDSEAKTLVCEDILYDNVEQTGFKFDNVILTNIGDYLPTLKKMFGKSVMGNAYQGLKVPTPKYMEQKGIHLFSKLVKKYPAQAPDVKIDPEKDIVALQYSGGTTGLPKAAAITHRNVVAVQAQTRSTWPFLEEGKETSIGFLGFFHIYGQIVVMLGTLTQGNTLVLYTTPDIDEILSDMERYRVSTFTGVPMMFEGLKEYDKTSRVDWKRLKVIVCGADTLHETTVNDWERRTGTRIMEGYGMTETTSVSHTSPYNRPKINSFGVPIPNVDAAIIDVVGTEFMPVGEEGELIVSGPNIMQGYWKRPEETKESIIELEGKKWLRTGDLVKMDEEGYFYFIDRKRDLIKYKGYSVFARHVEEVLYSHPQIKAAGVVGVPDPKVGQIIKAYVVLQGEARGKVSEEEISEFCKQNMAHYKVPKIIEFRGELPKTDVGKVSRRELREEAEEA
ncbi:MAG: AMP-binding protein [Deltaproteobacteria bacterium]|nr:AMP-binding protein [Deltaproteobacteria bacterium]